MPDENGRYTETPEHLAEVLDGFATEGWINVLGGCCGTTVEHIRARYRGIRLSPGYPALPDLEMQRPVFELLRPEEIGVELTGGLMMSPKASVSAVVLHHPEAGY